MRRLGTFIAAFVFSFSTFVATTVGNEPGETINGYPTVNKTWDKYTINYPAGRWEVTEENLDENRARFQLKPMGGNDVVLEIYISKGLPTEDPHYENNPQMINTSLLLGPALELAKKDESKIYFSTGVGITPAGWFTSARATILMDAKTALNLDACHEADLPNGRMLSAVVMTKSEAGQVQKDPVYNEKIVEAYEIIQSIHYEKPTADPSDEEVTE